MEGLGIIADEPAHQWGDMEHLFFALRFEAGPVGDCSGMKFWIGYQDRFQLAPIELKASVGSAVFYALDQNLHERHAFGRRQ